LFTKKNIRSRRGGKYYTLHGLRAGGEYPRPPVQIQTDMLCIGRSGAAPFTGTYLQGWIDNIHIYNRRLTPDEIALFEQMEP
jgi:hypothetical protein